MQKYAAGLFAAVAAAATGFVIHVGSQRWVQEWVSARMQGREVTASWDVRYLALASSLEVGIGLVVLYALVRGHLPFKSSAVRGLVLGVLLLAVMGRLVRQPLMNFIIGNPLPVVAVQDGVSWLVWLASCTVVACTYDRLTAKNAL